MRYITSLILIIGLVGCASQAAATLEPTPTDEPTSVLMDESTESAPQDKATPTGTLPVAPLVSVQRHGGLCVAGACQTTMTINSQGSISLFNRAHESEFNDVGVLTADELAELRSLINETDFAAIEAVPFTDICPTAYDGQEVSYEFYQEYYDGPLATLKSCAVVIDPTHPLIAWLDALWERVVTAQN